MPDFFISYTVSDRIWAEWIGWMLEEAGYSTVVQAWDFRPGTNFALEMQRAAATARRTIAVFSPGYLASRYGAPEWAAAFASDPEGLRRTLIPVRVRECPTEGLFKTVVHIDLVGCDEGDAQRRLLEGLKAGRAKPTSRSSFPGPAVARGRSAPAFPGPNPAVAPSRPASSNYLRTEDGLRTGV